MEPIILASASPRRRELLHHMRIPFKVIPPKIDESVLMARADKKIAVEIALKKVEAILAAPGKEPPRWILAADTIIEIGGKIIGKPDGIGQAKDYLRLLSGRIHRVHTGIALLPEEGKPIAQKLCTTKVKFRLMSDSEIEFYLDSGEWNGAAGAYRIQERGAFFIEWVHGSYSNVIGLPVETVYRMLLENGYLFYHPSKQRE